MQYEFSEKEINIMRNVSEDVDMYRLECHIDGGAFVVLIRKWEAGVHPDGKRGPFYVSNEDGFLHKDGFDTSSDALLWGRNILPNLWEK